jgi:hypothetical protein
VGHASTNRQRYSGVRTEFRTDRRLASLSRWTTRGRSTGHRLRFLNRTLFAGVPIPPLQVEIRSEDVAIPATRSGYRNAWM